MASKTIVYEIMIHHIVENTALASALQKHLYRNGIRAGLTNKLTINKTADGQSARHSLYFIGPKSMEQDLANVQENKFDYTFISPNFLHNDKGTSYSTLVNQLLRSREDRPISTHELRRMTKDSYNGIATQFTDIWFNNIPGDAIERFLKHLPHGATILDAGCGPGHHARFFKEAGFNPVGLDFSESMLNIATHKNKQIPFYYGDILSYNFPKEHFDGVWSAVALNHIPSEELPIALANLIRTLKYGGFVGLNFQVGRPSEIVSRESDRRFFEYPMNEYDIIYLLEAMGVTVVDTHLGTTTRNIHGLPLILRFATIIGHKSKSQGV